MVATGAIMRESSGTRGTQSGVLLTGGSGMVGRALVSELERRSIPVTQAVRGDAGATSAAGAAPKDGRIFWQPNAPVPFAAPAQLEGFDVAIHLSGANLAGARWTPAYKREIVSSRTVSTTALARTLAGLQRPPRLLIAASATGIYGDRGDEVLAESSPAGHGFLSETCLAWEAATAPAAGIRVVHLRLGVVLDSAGGALAKVLPLFRAGLGGRLGGGQQWMSWIAIDDLVRAVMHIAGFGADANTDANTPGVLPGPLPGTSLEGPVNCVSPLPVTNAEYTRALAGVLHRPALIPAPAFALRLALGEMADAALLASCRAVPEKLLASGFPFRFAEISAALAHLLAC
jgi:uncharacterized protein (TIGR01777 family)